MDFCVKVTENYSAWNVECRIVLELALKRTCKALNLFKMKYLLVVLQQICLSYKQCTFLLTLSIFYNLLYRSLYLS